MVKEKCVQKKSVCRGSRVKWVFIGLRGLRRVTRGFLFCSPMCFTLCFLRWFLVCNHDHDLLYEINFSFGLWLRIFFLPILNTILHDVDIPLSLSWSLDRVFSHFNYAQALPNSPAAVAFFFTLHACLGHAILSFVSSFSCPQCFRFSTGSNDPNACHTRKTHLFLSA